VDADVRWAITGHLVASDCPAWTLLSQIHRYVLPVEEHFTVKGSCTGVILVVITGVALGSPDISISMLVNDRRVVSRLKKLRFASLPSSSLWVLVSGIFASSLSHSLF
jgi:hypothetical protein